MSRNLIIYVFEIISQPKCRCLDYKIIFVGNQLDVKFGILSFYLQRHILPIHFI